MKAVKLGFWLMIWSWFSVGSVGATLESCTASMTPQTMATSQTSNFTITLNNTGSSSILFFQINMPSSNFSIQGKEASGWSGTSNSNMAQFWGGSLAAGGSLSVTLSVQSGASEVGAENWSVAANDVLSSDGTTACSGSLGVSISGVTDVVPPTISDTITISEVSANSAKVSWTTSENATSVVHYGTEESYGSSKNQSTLSTTQAVTLDSLTANTTYYFYVVSTDASNNSVESSGGTFTTAREGLTGTTVTVTNTVTTTTTQTVTKIVTDTTPPVVRINESWSLNNELWKRGQGIFESAPLITGSVSDDRGVAKVEYRIKNHEESWSTGSLAEAVGAKKTEWEFLPPLSLDGTYEIEIRGVDVFENKSAVKSIKFVIDQLLPTVGGGVISYGAMPLYAEGGVVNVLSGREYEVVLYEAGGADEVTLVINNQQYPITKLGTGGLWRGMVKLDGGTSAGLSATTFTSGVKAVDGAGNETEREWVKFRVIPNSKAKGELYYLDPTTKRFGLWEANEYGQKQGEIGWYVPSGEYYVQNGNVVSQRIAMDTDGWISGEWQVAPESWWQRILKMRRVANLVVPQSHSDTVTSGLAVAREKWIGKKSVVYFGTKELPWYGETKRRAEEWAKEENSQLVELSVQGVDDPKGEWLEKLNIGLLPQVYLINDKGDTTDFNEGVWKR